MDIRDNVIDFIKEWTSKTGIRQERILKWVGLHKPKYYTWQKKYGKANEHNASIPRDHWLDDQEKQTIIDFHGKNPLNGYRRLCYMMIDQNVIAVSPTTVRNVLKSAGLMDRAKPGNSLKGTGFKQPSGPHKHWHTDITYINLGGTFYYLSAILDGYSRYIVHWELRESMKEEDVEMIIQRALEKVPGVTPRIITDNGPQYVSRDFKIFVRSAGMTHVKTSPYYPQSNGKVEAWHKSLKKETIRPACPNDFNEAMKLITDYVKHYNNERLHSGIDYTTPADKITGRSEHVLRQREKKLEYARAERSCSRENKRASLALGMDYENQKIIPSNLNYESKFKYTAV